VSDDVEHINCPGCGRSVAEVAQRCLYCQADLHGRARRSSVPAPGDAVGAVRCALCGRRYLTAEHPGGCPSCHQQFADPIGKAEVQGRRRRFATQLAVRAGLAAIALCIGWLVLGHVSRSLPVFSAGKPSTVAMVAAAILALLAAWRIHDRAKAIGDPAWLAALITAVVTLVGVAPWCAIAVLWTNGSGLDGATLTVACKVTMVVPDGEHARYELRCKLDDGTPLAGIIVDDANVAPHGIGIALKMRRGRLGMLVAEARLPRN